MFRANNNHQTIIRQSTVGQYVTLLCNIISFYWNSLEKFCTTKDEKRKRIFFQLFLFIFPSICNSFLTLSRTQLFVTVSLNYKLVLELCDIMVPTDKLY